MPEICQECGASLEGGRRCRDYFEDLLALEWQVRGGPGQQAHFFAVASYNLQHPGKFTTQVLAMLRQSLADALAGRTTVAEVRQRTSESLDGATPVFVRGAEQGTRPEGWPTEWPMTVRDVCDVPLSRYLKQVHAWAAAVNSSLP